WTLHCPDCKDWCQTSIPSGLMLWHEGQFSSLASHRGSKRCVQAATRQRNKQSRTNDVRLLSRSHSLITAFSPSHCRSPPPPSDNCPGIEVVWPDDLRPFLMLFPWGRYHSGPDALPYTIDITQPSAPRARSKYCTHTRFQGSACDECTDVHRHILHLSEIARDPKQHTNYKYLGLGHLQDIAKTYAEQIKVLKLQVRVHSL
ncbi:hypothetical protein CY34DRAFT_93661, partial [Suillus luteus UH-Slu-Lm8-n1]